MKLHLRDKNPEVIQAWRTYFAGEPQVEISEGDILELEGDAIISPANSFGWMDGGIDLAYRERFGVQIEQALQRTIATSYAGELPVGHALGILTGDERIPYMIAAPTMRVPSEVATTVNAYLAMRAALLVARIAADPIVLCPGLCTLTGRMPPRRAAYQMWVAWRTVTTMPARNVSEIVNQHVMMERW